MGSSSAATLAAALLFTAALCLARPQSDFSVGEEAIPKPRPNDPCLTCLCHSKSSLWDTSRVQQEMCPPSLKFNCTESLQSGLLCGPYGVSFDNWFDAGRSTTKGIGQGQNIQDFKDCSEDFICATNTLTEYLSIFGEDCDGDGTITCRDYAAALVIAPYGLGYVCPQPSQQWIYQESEFQAYEECAISRDVFP